MSYQVLARKWRPQNFHQLVGQEHVKQALINALTQQRLHHAYLFTGTRGVGKTTIARIFAKSLNCELGITATPCGKCSACQDIEAGRYIDLLEIDAASRTKVEDTREILDNVQYAPTRGRYKVYLIDEVHMLSKHSFNALLKTLEEPPEHVKFLLATTDPQKLPVTILSRCLQFNLSALSRTEIATQLQHVLGQEQIAFDDQALALLAKAADGSMRDALSLTDQAIAQTNGQVMSSQVKAMLGLMDSAWAKRILLSIVANEGVQLLDIVADLAKQNANSKSVLDDLLSLTHLLLLTQLVPEAAALSDEDAPFINEMSQLISPEQVQIYYQLLLGGKKDLQWAPDQRLGLEMVLLRLLAFKPAQTINSDAVTAKAPSRSAGAMSNIRQLLAQSSTVDNQGNVLEPISDKNSSILQAPESVTQQPQVLLTESLASDDTENEQLSSQFSDVISQADAIRAASEQQFAQHSSPNSDTERTDVAQHSTEATQPYEQSMSSDHDNITEPQHQIEEHEVENQPNDLNTHSVNVDQNSVTALENQMSGAQSAIAAILRNRNVSGSGQLHSSQHDNHAQPEQQVSPEVKKTEPQQGGLEPVEPVSPIKQQPALKKRADIKSRHVMDPANLAPELLVQISDQPSEPDEVEVEVIDIPEGFVSPLTEVRFAHQQDHWAQLIEQMGLGGRIRQFALHGVYQRNDNHVFLQVDATQQHLDSQVMRDKLTESLSAILEGTILLQIDFIESVENTPYLIQQDLDEKRWHHAKQVIENDDITVQFQQRFSATIDENSIRAL